MDKIAILPAFGAILMLLNGKTPKYAFIYYFLPVLTLIPTYYETKLVQGVPEIAFWSAALLPVAAAWMINEKMEGYRFVLLDAIVLASLLAVFYAQFEATGYKDAQKILFKETVARLFPYIMIRTYFNDPENRVAILRVMATLGAIVAVFMLYEAKFYVNYLDQFIRRLWPYYVPWDGVMQRYGLKRASGSFGHPICAGYFFAMITPVAFWLWREGHYENQKHGLVIFGLCFAGALASISRAPIMGLFLSMAIIWYGWSKSKSLSGGLLVFCAVLGLALMLPKFISYVSVTRAEAVTQDQENAAYRKEMLDNYIEVIKEKPYWGYGRYTFPVINRQKSIDNEYLFIALTAGLVPLFLYLTIMFWVLIRLIVFAFQRPYNCPTARLAWCLLGGWICAIFTQATVYAGTQTVQYFFMIAAIAESIVRIRGFANNTKKTTETFDLRGVSYGYQFSRTL